MNKKQGFAEFGAAVHDSHRNIPSFLPYEHGFVLSLSPQIISHVPKHEDTLPYILPNDPGFHFRTERRDRSTVFPSRDWGYPERFLGYERGRPLKL